MMVFRETFQRRISQVADPSEFKAIASDMFNKVALVAGYARFRVVEIEFYLDPDPFIHADAMQINTSGEWYFHRQHGKGYKGGTFKGLDLTCGAEGCGGGILLRAIRDLSTLRYIEGPCNVVNHILKMVSAVSIAELVDRPSFTLSAFDPKACLRFESFQSRCLPLAVKKWPGFAAAPRVGLTSRGDDAESFRIAAYRFLAEPWTTKKDKGAVLRALVACFGLQDAALIAKKSIKQMRRYSTSKAAVKTALVRAVTISDENSIADDDSYWKDLDL